MADAPPGTACTKGTSYLSDVKFLKGKLGEARFAEVFAALPREHQAALTNILPHHWVSIPAMCALTQAGAAALGIPEAALAAQLGANNAAEHLHSLYRLFLKIGPADLLFKSTTSLWNNYYNMGKAEIIAESPGKRTIRCGGIHFTAASWCDRIVGYIEKGLALSGNRLISHRHPKCMSSGALACDYELEFGK
jgi:hypothetical protein